jgi:GNAT superfamily N-acetyltransferase
MRIGAGQLSDLARLIDLDGTIESTHYLHVQREGEGLNLLWRLEERPLREKRVDANVVGDDLQFAFKQVLGGVEEGMALIAEHDDQLVALAIARADAERKTLDVLDVRVDYDMRREGVGIAMLFQIISHARKTGMRAVTAMSLTNNLPAARFLLKAGFELNGVDTHFHSNHDLVKEAVALFWYAALD